MWRDITKNCFSNSCKMCIRDRNAFVCCSLNYIRMPRRLKELGGSAFHESALKKITVYGKVELNGTFKYCKKLKTVVLKKGVKKLGEYVFIDCPKLRSVTVPKGCLLYTSRCV